MFYTLVVRNTDKTCPKGGMMAQRNEAVAYETGSTYVEIGVWHLLKHFHTGNMEGGMTMFEKQFDGVVKVK